MKKFSAVVLALLVGTTSFAGTETDAPPPRQVTWCHPKVDAWPDAIPARGNVMPWQEMRIDAQVGGIRVASVLAGVGDRVMKGQVLASLDAESIETDLESAKGQLAEAEATRAQAISTLER
ncbi:MAG TPA: biotin/lipoyl-binding protein, partial [Rhodocyclaceae bacterium]|nr:biotin/lipoyl-binding protein [Rhodocyclaceae bacterium]